MSHIQANSDTLLRQASMTAMEYFDKAVIHIDDSFGKGYAKEHPELIAAFMQVAASDFNAANSAKSLAEAIEQLAETQANAIKLLATKISSGGPAF
jgi:hypothetical protein